MTHKAYQTCKKCGRAVCKCEQPPTTTTKPTTPAPTQGHTPEPYSESKIEVVESEIAGEYLLYRTKTGDSFDSGHIAEVHGTNAKGNALRFEVCWNACAGLTTKQVQAIPKLIDSVHMTNIKAFDAMREAGGYALRALDRLGPLSADRGKRDFHEERDALRAALKLADDCEGKT